jgi:IclR family mhp operon transcriptional activator
MGCEAYIELHKLARLFTTLRLNMDSTRPIRALSRGLDALLALNATRGATVAQVAQRIRLPRTTTYRILETLTRSGYVIRDSGNDCYRVTLRVRGLSAGFDDEAWITEIARPALCSLCDDVAWPVAMSAPAGAAMVIRASTDDRSPLALEPAVPGSQIPLLTSAAGLAFLAFSELPIRESLIELVSKTAPSDATRLEPARSGLDNKLRETRDRGFASAVLPKRVSDLIVLAMPVFAGGRVIASLSIRFSSSVVSMQGGIERFIPQLRATVSRIQTAFGSSSIAPA